MLITGQLLLESDDSPGRCSIVPGALRLADETIAELIVGELPRQYQLGGPDCLIAPGFIDTHLHLPQFEIIGAHAMPLLTWLDEVTFPAELKWQDVDYARAMTVRAIRQCLAHGTTAICAYGTVHHAATAAALQLADGMGLRGAIGQVMMDRSAPLALCRAASQLIDETADLLDRFPPRSRMATAVTPRFAISCTFELLAQAGALAAEHDAIVQTHLAETLPECERVRALFGGQSYVEVYRKAGLLSTQSILGHGIHLNEHDRQQLAASGATIAHCPAANAFLGSGTMQRHSLLRAGVGVTLGSDIGAGYERSMVRVARAMILAAASLGDPPPPAAAAWHGITAGNADRLGWADAGRLRPGAVADLVIIRPDIPWLEPPVDPLARLLFSWNDRWIEQTLLRGRTVFP
jgi:guanine deaminase